MMKLGGTLDSAPAWWAATLDSSDNLPTLFEAANEGRVARFSYRNRERHLEPWGLFSRGGFWYVIGWDRDAGERRMYRVDRIDDGVTTGEPGEFSIPDDFDLASAFDESVQSIGLDEGPAEALVLIDADRASSVHAELGTGAVRESRADGSLVVSVACRNRLVFRAWLLGFVDHAEVLEPVEVRHDVIEWLRGMVARG